MQRRAQQPITIRSDRAAALLRLLTSDGRSQAAVIEEALERMPRPDRPAPDEVARRLAAMEAALAGFDPAGLPSMAAFDAQEYDEHGLPR
jgi:antitoxin VapB